MLRGSDFQRCAKSAGKQEMDAYAPNRREMLRPVRTFFPSVGMRTCVPVKTVL